MVLFSSSTVNVPLLTYSMSSTYLVTMTLSTSPLPLKNFIEPRQFLASPPTVHELPAKSASHAHELPTMGSLLVTVAQLSSLP